MESKARKRLILRKAQLRGCILDAKALQITEDYLKTCEGEEDTLGTLLELIAEGEGGSKVTGDMAKAAVDRASAGKGGEGHDVLQILKLSEMPTIKWSDRIQGFTAETGEKHLVAPPSEKVGIITNRFYMLRQRLLRSVAFKRTHHSIYKDKSTAIKIDETGDEHPPLYKLASLEGTPSSLVMTVLARLVKEEDGLLLEDDTTSVRVSLEFDIAGNEESYTPGIFHDGAMVVAIGKWVGDVFKCDGMGSPPAEPRLSTIGSLATFIDFFGLAPPQNQMAALLERERASSHVVLILSGVQPEKPGTLLRLTSLLKGVASDPASFPSTHLTIVLAGNFLSTPFMYGDTLSSEPLMRERQRFVRTVEQIADCVAGAAPDVAKNAQFVFVPGPNDPGIGAGSYPVHPFPDVMFNGVRKKLPNTELASNPARMRFLTKEMVLFREDVYGKLMNHCLLPPLQEPSDVTLIKTLADQAHLLPLPPRFAPISPAFNAAMQLYPLPNIVILIDREKPWASSYKDCLFVNPGCFSRTGSFLTYRPSDGAHQLNAVPA
eukprot:TRINITY_DN20102_c0_g1_i1.p1 TRINITY_DN20102_c0_g1~~TRINITY_DN20102_c0_g1_i1.p1  ORF type:complete len:547 (+),score=69.87 TRINITY_DN20102_c0_g1_i1:61-1701(+)